MSEIINGALQGLLFGVLAYVAIGIIKAYCFVDTNLDIEIPKGNIMHAHYNCDYENAILLKHEKIVEAKILQTKLDLLRERTEEMQKTLEVLQSEHRQLTLCFSAILFFCFLSKKVYDFILIDLNQAIAFFVVFLLSIALSLSFQTNILARRIHSDKGFHLIPSLETKHSYFSDDENLKRKIDNLNSDVSIGADLKGLVAYEICKCNKETLSLLVKLQRKTNQYTDIWISIFFTGSTILFFTYL